MHKILLALALFAAYAIVSNQDFEDQQIAHQQWNKKN